MREEGQELMVRGRRFAIGVGVTWVCAGVVRGEQLYPTPEMTELVKIEIGSGKAWGMRSEIGDSGIYVGVALACRDEEPLRAEGSACSGGFPEDRRSVQLAVRSADGTVERFGPVVRGAGNRGFTVRR